MLSEENEVFLAFWEANREKQRTSIRPLLMGMSGGFAIGVLVLISLETGWYTRATMVANSRMSSVIFLLAIMILSVCMAFIYRKFRWEMNEQRYLELKYLKNKSENKGSMQP